MNPTMIDRDLFNKHLLTTNQWAKKMFLDDPEDGIMPHLCVRKDEGGDDWTLDIYAFAEFGETRYQLFEAIGTKYGQAKAHIPAIYLVSEGWLSISTKEEMEAHPDNRVMPSEDPDRQEVLLVSGLTLDMHTVIISHRIKRSPKSATLEEQDFAEVAEARSPLLICFFRGYVTAFMEHIQ